MIFPLLQSLGSPRPKKYEQREMMTFTNTHESAWIYDFSHLQQNDAHYTSLYS